MGRPKLLMEFDGRVAHRPRRDGPPRGRRRAGRRRRRRPTRPRPPRSPPRPRRPGPRCSSPRRQPAEMRDSVELGLAVARRRSAARLRRADARRCPGITPTWSPACWRSPASSPDRIVDPDSRRPPRSSDRPAVGHRRPRSATSPTDAGVNRLVATASRCISSRCRSRHPARSSTSTRRTISNAGGACSDRCARPDVTMQVHVRLFALAKERAGRAEMEVELPEPPRSVTFERPCVRSCPQLGALAREAMIAVDEEYAGDDDAHHVGSRLAVIPPVSGGRGRVGSGGTAIAMIEITEVADRSRGGHGAGPLEPGGGGLHVSGHGPRDHRRRDGRSRSPTRPIPRWP